MRRVLVNLHAAAAYRPIGGNRRYRGATDNIATINIKSKEDHLVKKKRASILAATAVATVFLVAPGAQAANFEGYSAGLKAGLNFASDSFTNSTTFTVGAEGGYLIPGQVLAPSLPSSLRIGADVFFDLNMNTSHTHTTRTNYYFNAPGNAPVGHSSSYGTDVIGADAKVGYAMGQFMPYAKFGLADLIGTGDMTGGSIGLHFGVGAEYLLSQTVGATVEWTYDSADGIDNNNITAGAVYRF